MKFYPYKKRGETGGVWGGGGPAVSFGDSFTRGLDLFSDIIGRNGQIRYPTYKGV